LSVELQQQHIAEATATFELQKQQAVDTIIAAAAAVAGRPYCYYCNGAAAKETPSI